MTQAAAGNKPAPQQSQGVAKPRPVSFWADHLIDSSPGSDEVNYAPRMKRIKRLVWGQACVILILAIALAIVLPISRPMYIYYAVKPDKTAMRMMGLNIPNMTNRAVIAWATNSVTEIMTVGFGDIDTKLRKQKWRFTSDGWDAFTTAFDTQSTDKKFKQNQLVLTTVPSDTPVITAQGVNADGAYQWTIQMPIIMTYATNNNVTRHQKHLVELQIVRVPAASQSAGIAIQSWDTLH